VPRTRNERLDALLREAGWSRAQTATAFNRVAVQSQAPAGIGRSHVSMWVGGTTPAGDAAVVLCEALSRRLKRLVTPGELGFAAPGMTAGGALQWDADPLAGLADLGRADLDPERRAILTGSIYSAAALALPAQPWWDAMAAAPAMPLRRQRTGRGDVETVRQLTAAFSRIDQRRGGGHGRRGLAQYLRSDVAELLQGTFADDDVRRDMFSAASEVSYLSGWMAFDNSEHAIAQQYFILAVKLAARADDAPLSGHILRAMAHQAIDLGQHKQGLDLAAASVDGRRYAAATPRERALLGVVHARALAANGLNKQASRALLKAEDDLAQAGDGIEEPDRTFFFGEASLAHETACTLRDTGDRVGAISQFQRSVHVRGAAFRRTHAVTLGYLGATQVAGGAVEEACSTWSMALDAMEDGICSGRARQCALDMRVLLSPYRHRGIAAAAELDHRARKYLAEVD
jgi:hypothetical protein